MLVDQPKITGVRFDGPLVDVGTTAAKAMPPGRRYRYSRKIIYTIEGRNEEQGCVYGITKPKMQWQFDNHVESINRGKLFAWYGDNGEFHGTTRVYG